MRFLQKFELLKNSTPMMTRYSLDNENSPMVNRIHVLKNVFWAFDGGIVEDSAYLYFPYKLANCFDCDFTYESELCYQCVDCYQCYDCAYCQQSQRLTNCQACLYCRNCQNCFGCVGLQHKQHCIFNQQYSKTEYQQKIKELRKQPISQHLLKVKTLVNNFPRVQSEQYQSVDCPYGDHISTSKSSYWIFDCIRMQDSAYCYQSKFSKNSLDLNQCYECELCYQCDAMGFSYNSSFSAKCSHVSNCHYCVHCEHSHHLFGCINLNHSQYCILNKQYSQKEYFTQVKKIKHKLGWPTEVV